MTEDQKENLRQAHRGSSMKKALVTGCAGQDGGYLAEHLLNLGYKVFGMVRPSVSRESPRLEKLAEEFGDKFELVQGDMQDSESLSDIVMHCTPQEIYNLAAISYAPQSWRSPSLTMDVNGTGVTRLLESVHRHAPEARFYQASTSEMFGAVCQPSQDESSPFRPVHPYGAAKVAGHWNAVCFREQYGLHVSCGILFNHESQFRHAEFVTQKIVRAAVAAHKSIKQGSLVKELELWTLDPVRDWGFAGEYVTAMHAMLQQDEPGDYVVGTGVGHSVRDVASVAYSFLDMNYEDHVVVKPPGWFVPDSRAHFIADASLIKERLNWQTNVTFEDLIQMMVNAEMERAGWRPVS